MPENENACALVAAEFEQVFVADDDGVSAAGEGAFGDAVDVGVSLDMGDGVGRADNVKSPLDR